MPLQDLATNLAVQLFNTPDRPQLRMNVSRITIHQISDKCALTCPKIVLNQKSIIFQLSKFNHTFTNRSKQSLSHGVYQVPLLHLGHLFAKYPTLLLLKKRMNHKNHRDESLCGGISDAKISIHNFFFLMKTDMDQIKHS